MNRIRPNQHDLDLFLGGKHGEVRDLVFQHVAGILPPERFGEALRSVLVRGHAGAGYLGRRRAGDMAPYDADDTAFGEMLTAEETRFVEAFVEDLAANRYEGEDGRPAALPILNRVGMYVDRMRGSANEAFVLASGREERFEWRLGGAEAHCTDCPEIAAGSPYSARDLPGFPGSGSTSCLVACKCRLLREDGVSGFR